MSKKSGSRTSKPKFDPRIVKAHKAYVNAINSNITSRVMACYDKDAQVMQPDGPLVHGHKAIEKWVAGYFKEYKTHWDKVSKLIWVAGDYGFDQGVDSAVDIPRNGGCTQRYTVKGLLIYKRQANGEFKVYRDIWNFNSVPTFTRG
ncbi:MAG: hypothetical protein NTZ43_14195 [Gemmatimonadetes bacterium]|nr:hypothetical protein [Gemmatimonadota bacterium]